MKKFAILVASSIALFSAQAANATTYSPTGTWTWAGNVQVQKGGGPLLTCRLTVNATVTATSATATASLGLGDIRCLTVSLQGAPYPVSHNPGPPETLTISGVYADTTITAGDCAGNITAVFNDTSPAPVDALVVNALLPEVTAGTGNCTIVGTLLKTAPAGAISVN